jgi:hypothetical protein
MSHFRPPHPGIHLGLLRQLGLLHLHSLEALVGEVEAVVQHPEGRLGVAHVGVAGRGEGGEGRGRRRLLSRADLSVDEQVAILGSWTYGKGWPWGP